MILNSLAVSQLEILHRARKEEKVIEHFSSGCLSLVFFTIIRAVAQFKD